MIGGYDLPLRSAMGTTMLCHKNSHLKGTPSKQSPRILWKGMAFFKIFDIKIQPILMYASEIWGTVRLDGIEKVHMMACKRFLGVPLRTPNKMVYGELGRYPLFVNSTLRCLKYWLRVLKMDDIRIPKQAYKMMILMDESEKKCWVTEVKNVLSKNGFLLCLVTTRGWRRKEFFM